MPYETQSQWNEDELKKLNRAALLKLHKPYLAFIIFLEAVFVCGLVVSALIRSGTLMAEFAVLLVALPLVLVLVTNFRVKKEFRSSKLLQTTVSVFRFHEDRLESASDRGTAFVRYDELYRIVETKTNFYLFISKGQALNVIKANCSEELIAFLHEKSIKK